MDIIKKSHNVDLKQIHFKSIENFTLCLLNENSKQPHQKSNLKGLGKLRKKELLLEYLIEIEKKRYLTTEESIKLFKQYIYPIGLFMSSCYGFSYLDLSTIGVKILMFLVPVIIVDFLVLELTGNYYFLSILIIILFITRYGIKYFQGKLFGFRY